MNELLSWTSLPNLHPALVHFPIALVPMAILADVLRLVFRRQEWLDRAATGLYIAAALGALAALWAGEQAADGLVAVPAEVQPLIGRHSDWAHYALWTLGGVAVLRLAITLRKPGPIGIGLRLALLAPSLAALCLVTYVADLGGALVFRHGVAIEAASRAEPDAVEPETPGTSAASTSAAGTSAAGTSAAGTSAAGTPPLRLRLAG